SAAASSNYALDTTAPSPPTITSSPPNPSMGRNPSWSFTGESGASFQCRLTRPGTTVSDWASCSSPKSYDLTGQPDATYTFEVRQTDQVGNGPSSPRTSSFLLDSTPPAAPGVTSTSHPDPTETYTNDDPAFSWTASDASGVAGYSYVLDQEPATAPDTVSEGTAQSRSYVDLSDGTWWFHVAARDDVGLWSAPAHFQIDVDLPAAMPQSLLVSPRQIYPADLPLLGRPSSTRIHARVSGAGWQIQVLTPSGQTVRTFDAPAGASTSTWNGRDAAGAVVPDGPYEIRLRSVSETELNGDSAWVTVGEGPAIAGVTPNSASLNEEIVITGSGFTSEVGGFGVSIGGHEADVVSWSPTSIRVFVPVELDAGPQEVVVTAADRESTPATLTIKNYLIDPDAPAEGYIRVKVNDGVSAAALALAHGDAVLEQLLPDETDAELLRWWDISVPLGTEASKVVEYASDPNVEWAETEVTRAAHATPDDPQFAEYQWNLHQPGNDHDIDAPEAWDVTKGSANVTIAVVDSDVRNHPDLSTNLTGIRSLTDGCPDRFFSHGTHVAGIAAADTNDGEGVAGVGWNTRVFGYETGFVYKPGTPKEDCRLKVKHTVRAISHASLNGRDVVNMSYGDFDVSDAEKEIMRKAWERGLVLVAAAGNDGEPKKRHFPAALPNVLSVGATRRDGTVAGYSNTGAWIDVYAPGGHPSDQLNTQIAAPSWRDGTGGTWWTYGTSMASPAVAGIAGLLKGLDPAASNGAIVSAIQASVEGSPQTVSAAKAIAKLVDIRLPNGIFVRNQDRSKVWFVDGDRRHEVLNDVLNTWGIPGSRSPLVAAVPGSLLRERRIDRDRPLGIRPGKLISPTDSDTIFFVSNDPVNAGESWTRGRRLPMSTTTITCLGFSMDVIEVRPAALRGNPVGPEWTDCTRHPNGTVIQDGARPSVLQNDRRRNIQTDSVLDSWGMAQDVTPSNLGDTLLPTGNPIGLRPGTVARFRENGPVWFITSAGNDFAQGDKRQFERPAARGCYGFGRLSPRLVEGEIGSLHANGTVLKC
ncbi:MAG: S8 family serine peptidase, partial [Actinomycetota bacterium]|nr:S8 family serine peptidase [Actinomycetota bacterium]